MATPAVTLNGATANGTGSHALEEAAGLTSAPSTYLRYLPSIYWSDPFIGRFLRVLEDVFSPIQATVSRRTEQFDPALASSPMLEALASWVGADLAAVLPAERARKYIKQALTLHRWRGTKAGLRLALNLATGRRPYITEFSPGLVLGDDAALGINTTLAEGRPLQIHVAFDCPETELDGHLVHAIIRRYKPAHTSYTVAFHG